MLDPVKNIPPGLVPGPVLDLMNSLRGVNNGQDLGFNIFKASMWTRLLLCVTQSIKSYEHGRLDEVRSATVRALEYFGAVISRPMIQLVIGVSIGASPGSVTRTTRTLKGSHRKVFDQANHLIGVLQELKELPLICGMSSWTDLSLHGIFRQLLEDGLVTMVAHVYVYLRLNKRVDCILQLDSFCQKHQDRLFWNGEPKSCKHWQTSYRKWALPVTDEASRFAKRRHERNPSLMMALVKNGFKLTSDVSKKLNDQPGIIYDSLGLELEQEVPIDTVHFYDTVWGIVQAKKGANLTLKMAIDYLDGLLQEASEIHAKAFFRELSCAWLHDHASVPCS